MTEAVAGKEAVESWSVDQVAAWLEGLQLNAVVPQFRVNAVDGSDLLGLSSDDLTAQLGCTPLQARKIRTALAKATGDASLAASTASLESQAAAPSYTAPTAAVTPVAMGVPVAPAAPAAPAMPAIAAMDLSRYKMLSMKIDELERIKAPDMLAQAQRSEQYLASALATDSTALTKMETAVQEEEEKVDKLENHFNFDKLLGRKHLDAKVAEHMAMLTKLRAERDAQRARIEEDSAKLGEARKVLTAWSAKAADLQTARRDRMALMERIFAAPDWAGRDPLLSLSRAQAELHVQERKAHDTAQIYARAKTFMTQAMGKFEGALQALGQTQMMGMMEMGMDIGRGPHRGFGPGNMMADFVEMGAVQRANDLVQSAAQDITAARGVLPSMPFIDEALLKAATIGIFQNVLFNNAFSDMLQMMMVRESIGQVQKMAGEAQQLLEWVNKNLVAFEAQAATHRAAAEGKASEARAYWQQQLDKALAAGGGGTGELPLH